MDNGQLEEQIIVNRQLSIVNSSEYYGSKGSNTSIA